MNKRDYCSPTSHWKNSKSSSQVILGGFNLRLPVIQPHFIRVEVLPKKPQNGSIHFSQPTRKFHFPFSSLWDKVLGCNVEGFHVLDIEQKSEACKTKKKHMAMAYVKKGCSEVRWKANIFEPKICRKYSPFATLSCSRLPSMANSPFQLSLGESGVKMTDIYIYIYLSCHHPDILWSGKLGTGQWILWLQFRFCEVDPQQVLPIRFLQDLLQAELKIPTFFERSESGENV